GGAAGQGEGAGVGKVELAFEPPVVRAIRQAGGGREVAARIGGHAVISGHTSHTQGQGSGNPSVPGIGLADTLPGQVSNDDATCSRCICDGGSVGGCDG